ncbi:hypothetical protein QQ008_18400 [Fulvivirgaceae bacterium BMA10]|uniref:Uncharacterized protein n=1 Tax=Splendidivirga corallicola TaxID=3051826 RepID=A0ABT8KRI7_9BACT|nr:hypothetical protein [Fulvivirgaceae bacterium BMA10]
MDVSKYKEELIGQSIVLISQHLNIDADNLYAGPEMEKTSFTELHEKLTNLVSQLIDHDFERLLNALYKIDVSEQKFKQILAVETPDNISAEVAMLIIEREYQKVVTRLKYKGVN